MASASRSRGWLIWVGIVLAACDKIPTVQPRPELQTYRATPDVWSGGELVVTSHGFAAESLPDILLDGQLLAVRRVDDTTVAAVAPDRPGPHTLRVVARVVDPHAVVVQLRGFVNRIEGPLLSGRTEPGRDTRYLFGSGPTGLRRWNIRTNKAIELGDTVHAVSCTRGVGPGPTVGDLVLLTGGCSTGRWLVWHTEPLYPLTDTASAMTDHFVAVLQTGRWVVLADATFSVTACDSGVCTAETIPGTAVSDVVHSPRRDRAVLLAGTIGDSGTPGVPVIDVGLGSVGYRVRALRRRSRSIAPVALRRRCHHDRTVAARGIRPRDDAGAYDAARRHRYPVRSRALPNLAKPGRTPRVCRGNVGRRAQPCGPRAAVCLRDSALRGDVDDFHVLARRHARADIPNRIRIHADIRQHRGIGGALRRGHRDAGERLLLPPGLNRGDGALMNLLRERAAHRRFRRLIDRQNRFMAIPLRHFAQEDFRHLVAREAGDRIRGVHDETIRDVLRAQYSRREQCENEGDRPPRRVHHATRL